MGNKSKPNIVLAALVCTYACMSSNISANELRDPTTPLGYSFANKQAVQLVLQAIFNKAGGNTAVINGLQVKRGSVVNGAKILRIDEKKVFYLRNGESGVLTLRPSVR